MHLLLLEDDPDLGRSLVQGLVEEGHAVALVGDGETAARRLDEDDFDAAILDIMVPRRDGLTVLRDLRGKGSRLPVLLLSARDTVDDRVAGLDAGADDYLVKPFAFSELLARLRAFERRTVGDQVLMVGDLHLDQVQRVLLRDGHRSELSGREAALLAYLMRHPGQVIARSELHEAVWHHPDDGLSNVVDVYITYLRRKTEGAGHPRCIHTCRGQGYVFRPGPAL